MCFLQSSLFRAKQSRRALPSRFSDHAEARNEDTKPRILRNAPKDWKRVAAAILCSRSDLDDMQSCLSGGLLPVVFCCPVLGHQSSGEGGIHNHARKNV